MKQVFFTFFALSTLLFSCGESGTSDSDVKPVEVMAKDWVDILTDDYDVASNTFEDLIEIQESDISTDQLTQKSDEAIEKMNSLVSKTNSYTISGLDADKLSEVADNYKAKNNAYFNAIVDYANIVKENTDLLLKKDWSDAEDEKFEKTILTVEDKVYFASDASDKADSDFADAQDAL